MRGNKIVLACMLGMSLVGCSSNTASSSTSIKEENTQTEITYEEVYELTNVEMNTTTFHGVTYETPASIAGRKLTNGSDTLTYLMKGQNDTIEVHFEEVNSNAEDVEEWIDNIDTKTYCDVIDYVVNEETGMYIVHGITKIYGTTIYEGNCDLYIVMSAEGIVVFRITYDIYGTVDYSSVYQHLVDSIQIG